MSVVVQGQGDSPALDQSLQQVVGPDEVGPVAPLDGPPGQGHRQVGRAHAGGGPSVRMFVASATKARLASPLTCRSSMEGWKAKSSCSRVRWKGSGPSWSWC